MRWLGRDVMSSPRYTIVPDVGLSRPVMQLTNVVLPAPFGPRTPRISPRRIVRSTPSSAARPPKRFVMPVATRIGSPDRRDGGTTRVSVTSRHPVRANVREKTPPAKFFAGPGHRARRSPEGNEAAGQKHDEENDENPENGRMELEEVAPHVRREQLVDAGAEKRTEPGAGAADHDGDDRFERVVDLEEVRRRHVDVLVRGDAAREGGESRRKRVGERLVAGRRDAEHARRVLVLTNRHPRVPDLGPHEQIGE